MNRHPVLSRLRDAGFAIVPVLNMHGSDTGVLAWRRDPRDLVVVTAWSDDFAVGARVPHRRNWTHPFAATGGPRYGPADLAEVVESLLAGRRRLLDEPLPLDSLDCAPFAEGAS